MIFILFACLLAAWPLLRLVVYLDREFLHEQIREFRTELLKPQGWQAVPEILDGLDYSWINGVKPLRIGHALGASGTSLANSLDALPAASADGLRLLEVDLWLTSDGALRCHHGPGAPGLLTEKSCTFDRLVSATERDKIWLILDIKTDFSATAHAVVSSLKNSPLASVRIIFQLYGPADIKNFIEFSRKLRFAGPILTAYGSLSSLDVVAAGARRARIRVLTFPLNRKSALSRVNNDLYLLTHPVHECESYHKSMGANFDGFYTLSGLHCR